MNAKKPPEKPLLSGAHLGPECARDLCDGYRDWPTPVGRTVEGHCWCPTGRSTAEVDYAFRHNQPAPALPDLAEVAS